MVSPAILFVLATQTTPIDFEVRATSLTNALGKLSRVTGTTYQPSAELQGEVVCIRVKNVTVSDLTKRLADTVTAVWVQDGDKMILRRTPEQVKEIEQKIFVARRNHLRKLFEAKAKELSALNTPEAQAENFTKALKALNDKIAENPRGLSLDGPRLAAPVSTLANLLAIDLGADTIAAIPQMERRTFTLSPNRAQFALGPNAKKLIQNYEEAETQLTPLIGGNQPKDGMVSGLLDDIYDRSTAGEPIGKVFLNVSNRGRITSLNVLVFTASGKQRSWGLAGTYHMGDDPWKEEREAGQGKAADWTSLSEGSREFFAIAAKEPNVSQFPGEQDVRPWSELSDTAKKILLNPETVEPLSLTATDATYALATQDRPNVIAYMSDSMVEAANLSSKDEKLDLTRFRALLPTKGHRLAQSAGWIVITPTYATTATQYRLNRNALGKFMKRSAQVGNVELEHYCRYQFEAGEPVQYSYIERLYRRTAENFGVQPMAEQNAHAHAAYAALGSLNSVQWKNLRAGNSLRFGQLPTPQRMAGEKWIIDWNVYLQTSPNVVDLLKQPSEFAVNGLSRNTTLSSTSGPKLVLRSYGKIRGMDGKERMGSLEFFGQTAAEHASGFARGGYYKSVEQFKTEISLGQFECAERDDLTVTLQFLDTHWIEETFRGSPRNAKIVTFDKLPESVKREFIETFEKEFRARGEAAGRN